MKLEEIIEIVKHDAEYFADPKTGVQAGRAFEANKIFNMLYKLEQAQLQQHGVGGPGSDVRSEGEQLGNEAGGKAGAVEVINIKTGMIFCLEGFWFVFGKDLNTGEIKCFNIDNVSGESRDGALH